MLGPAPRLVAERRSALRALASSFLPVVLVAVIYRMMSRANQAGTTPARVHVCDLRRIEIGLVGISLDGRPATVHDWLQQHATPTVDLLCALPYAAFLLACVAFLVFAFVHP